MMIEVPIQALPRQNLQILLAEQACSITLYQTNFGLFFDLYVSNVPVVLGVIAENLNRMVRYSYLGFTGDFFFYDTQGTSDPLYEGLGQRYRLYYLEEGEGPQED